MIRQVLGSFKLPRNLTKKTVLKIARIKPMVPWIIAALVVVAILIFGIDGSFVPITGLSLLATVHADEPEEPTAANEGDRYITLSATTNEESAEPLASGNFYLMKTDTALISAGFGTQGTGKDDPTPMYMFDGLYAPL